MSQGMMRFALLIAVGLVGALGAPAARAQDELSDVVARLGRLEETLRNLTGSVEQLQYRNQQLEQQVQAMQAALQARGMDVRGAARQPYQPTTPAATPYTPAPPQSPYAPAAGGQYPSASPPPRYSPPYAPPPPPAPVAPAGNGPHDAFNPALDPNAPGAPRPLGASTTANEPPPPYHPEAGPPPRAGEPLNLSSLSPQPGSATPPPAEAGRPGGPGTGGPLPPPPPSNPSATGSRQASLPPANTPKAEYELGYGYIQRRDYALAADTFRRFVHDHPSDRLAPEAQFWLGEALFQTQHYHDAAEAFLTVSTKYETMPKAPEALLRLGQSLAALGQKEAACASLGEVLRKYPHASSGVKQGVEREQKRTHC